LRLMEYFIRNLMTHVWYSELIIFLIQKMVKQKMVSLSR
jgi:hypothetical protein